MMNSSRFAYSRSLRDARRPPIRFLTVSKRFPLGLLVVKRFPFVSFDLRRTFGHRAGDRRARDDGAGHPSARGGTVLASRGASGVGPPSNPVKRRPRCSIPARGPVQNPPIFVKKGQFPPMILVFSMAYGWNEGEKTARGCRFARPAQWRRPSAHVALARRLSRPACPMRMI